MGMNVAPVFYVKHRGHISVRQVGTGRRLAPRLAAIVHLGIQDVDDSVEVLYRRELNGHLALTSS